MDDRQIRSAAKSLCGLPVFSGVTPTRVPSDLSRPTEAIAIAHILFLLREVPHHLDSGKTGKAVRWLCFAQGVLWAHGLAATGELKNLMRPKDTTYNENI